MQVKGLLDAEFLHGRRVRGPLITITVMMASLILAMALPALAREPDGHIRFQTEGVQVPATPPEGLNPGESVLRITLEGVVALSEATITSQAPGGAGQRVFALTRSGATLRAEPLATDPHGRLILGQLNPGEPLNVDFALEIPSDAGGIFTVTVEFSGPDGSPRRESYGVPIGQVGAKGILRDDALEFPAHEIQENNP